MPLTLSGLGAQQAAASSKPPKPRKGIMGALFGPSGHDPLGVGHLVGSFVGGLPGLGNAALQLAQGAVSGNAEDRATALHTAGTLGRGTLTSLGNLGADVGLAKPLNAIGHATMGDKFQNVQPFWTRAGSQGLLSPLVEDVGNVVMLGQAGAGMAKVFGGAATKEAVLAGATREAEHIGLSAENIERAKVAGRTAAQPGESLGGTGRLSRLTGNTGTLLDEGISGPKLKAVAKASRNLEAAGGAEAAAADTGTFLPKVYEAGERMAHPYKAAFEAVGRPLFRAGREAATADAVAATERAKAAQDAAQAGQDAVSAANAAKRASAGPAGRAAAQAAEEAASMSGAMPEDAARIGEEAAAAHGEQVTQSAQAAKAAAAAAKSAAEESLLKDAIAPRTSMAGEKIAAAAAKPIPEWAQNFVAGENRAGKIASKLAAPRTALDEGVGRARVTNFLNKGEGVVQGGIGPFKGQAGQLINERKRFMEIDRRNLFHHPAVTASKAAIDQLVSDFGIEPAKASAMVGDQLMAELDNRAMLLKSRAMGLEGTQFDKMLNDALDRQYPMAPEQMAAVRPHLDEALTQWKTLADENYQRALGSPGRGAEGLADAEFKGEAFDPAAAMTPKQHKMFNQMLEDYQRIAGQDGPAKAAAAERARMTLAASSTLDKLADGLQRTGVELEGQRRIVVDAALPDTLRAANRSRTVARLVDVMLDGGTYDPFTDSFVSSQTGAQAAVGVIGEVVPQAEFAADPAAAFDRFVNKYESMLANQDAKIGVWQNEGNVYLDISQTTLDGRTLSREQAAVMGMARGEKAIWDFGIGESGNEASLPNDAVSMAVASQHVGEIAKPGSQFNRVLREMGRARSQLDEWQSQAAVTGALMGAPETATRLSAEAWDDLGNVMMRQAAQGTAVGASKSLDAWYGKIAVEARKTDRSNPAAALMQVYMQPSFETAMQNLPEAWNDALRQTGDDGKKALDWYFDSYNTVASRFPEDHVTQLPRLVDGEWRMSPVSTRDLIWSIMAVTSVNANPIANAANTFEGLVGLSSAPWATEGLTKTVTDAIEKYHSDRRVLGATKAGVLKDAPELLGNIIWQAIGAKIGHTGGVRADVMDIITERTVPEFTNEWLLERQGARVPEHLAGLPEREAMNQLGSSAYAKIRNFYENMSNPESAQGVTLDRVMAQAFGMGGESWDGEQYARGVSMVTKLADEMSAAYGVRVYPHQAQALLWVGTKKAIAETELGRRYAVAMAALDGLAGEGAAAAFGRGEDPISQWYAHEVHAAQAPGITERTQDFQHPGELAFEPQSGMKQAEKRASNAEGRAKLAAAPREQRTFYQKISGNVHAQGKVANEAQSVQLAADAWNTKRLKIADLLDAGKMQAAEDELYSWIAGQQQSFSNPAEYFSDFQRAGIEPVRGVGPARVETANAARGAGWMPEAQPGFEGAGSIPEGIQPIEDGALAAAQENLRTHFDTMRGVEGQGVGDNVAGLHQATEDISNGLTYTNTQTGRITMRFFRTADPTTLLHENAHLLRQMLPESDVKLLTEAYSIPAAGGRVRRAQIRNQAEFAKSIVGKQGPRAFEEHFAEDVIRYMNTREAPPGLENTFQRIQASLSSWWKGFHGSVDDNVADVLNRWLVPSDPQSIPLPDFGKSFERMSPQQIARTLKPLPEETAGQTLARGQRAGQAAQRAKDLTGQLAADTARQTRLQGAFEDMVDTLNETLMPPEAARLKRMQQLEGKMAKTLGDANAPGNWAARLPVQWKAVGASMDELWKLATEHADPAVRASMSDLLADMPKTLSEFIGKAVEDGFDPQYVARISDTKVRNLVYGRFEPGLSSEVGGFRKARRGATPLDRSVEALMASHLQVVHEANTNALVQDIEKHFAIPITAGVDIPQGFVAWDDARKYLHTEGNLDTGLRQAVNPGAPSLMIPESVARTLKRSTADYNHWLLTGARTMISPWRTFVLTLTPRWYVNNVLGNAILATHGGVKLEDWVAAWKQFRTEEGQRLRTQVGGESLTSDLGGERTLGNAPRVRDTEGRIAQVKQAKNTGLEKLGKLNTVVDDFARSATYLSGVRTGMSEEAALQHALTSLVDYSDLGPAEQAFVRTAIPFYAWQKGILKMVAKYPLDHPIRTSIMVQLGKLNQHLMADLPDRYQQGIKTPFGLLDIRAMNPFADAATLTSPQGIRESLNPVIGSILSNAFDSPASGYPEQYRIDQYGRAMPTTDLAGDLGNIVSSLPQVTAMGGGGTAGFLGIPKLRSESDLAAMKLRLKKSKAKQAGLTQKQAGIPSTAKPKPLSQAKRAAVGLPPVTKAPKPFSLGG